MKLAKHLMRFFFVLAIPCLIIWGVSQIVMHKAEAESLNYLNVNSVYTAQAIKSMVDGDLAALNAMAAFAGSHDTFDLDHLIPILQQVYPKDSIRRLGIISPSGKGMGAFGNTFDASHMDYFNQAMTGKTVVSSALKDRFTGLNIIVYSTPIYHKNKIEAVLFSTRSAEDLKDCVAIWNNTDYAKRYLVDSKGEEVFDSGKNDKASNIFTTFAQYTFAQESKIKSFEALQKELKSGATGTLKLYNSQEDNNEIYLNYVPIGIGDWHIFTVMSNKELSGTFDSYKGILYAVSFSLVILGILIAAIFYWEQGAKNKLIVRNAEMMETIVSKLQGAISKHLPDQFLTFTYMNEGFLQMTGYTQAEISQKFDNRFSNLLVEEDVGLLNRLLQNNLKPGYKFNIELHLKHKDGQRLTINCAGIVTQDEQKNNIVYCTIMDITDKQKTILNLAEKTDSLILNEMSFQLAILNANMIMFDYFPQEKRIDFSEFILDGVNIPKKIENVPQNLLDLEIIAPESKEILFNGFAKIDGGQQNFSFIIKAQPGSGLAEWQEITLTSIIYDGDKVKKAIGLIHDVTQEKKRQDWLEAIAQTDQMTGIYNKTATEAIISESFYLLSDKHFHGLMIIDVDNFKTINDTLGHVLGDEVLIAIAGKLKQIFRISDVVGRVGGDEFMVFVKDVGTMQALLQKAQDVCLGFNAIKINGHEDFLVSPSVGVAIYGRDGTTFAQLYKNADIALYAAKNSGRNQFCVYDDSVEHTE